MTLGECPICFDLIKNRDNASLNCGHLYHLVCILQWFETRRPQKTCTICRREHFGEPIHLYLGDDDDDDDDDTASVTPEVSNQSTSSSNAAPRRKKVRCMFWPNCKLGKNCLYVHPKKKCEAFSFKEGKCMRRDMCFYLHPQCKQGNNCTDTLCRYSHIMRSVKTQGGDGEQPSNESTWCLHKTTCRNKDCPKRHPQMCKFDPKCTEETCTFWHPKRNLQGFKKIKNTKKTEEKK